jgi:type I restriction enzyme, S subunit
MSELPFGWAQARIGDLISAGGVFVDGDWIESKDQDPTGDVRLIQLADIGDGTFRNRSSRFLTSSKARELRCTFLQSGDVLVARMPDPLGRACIFPGVAQPAVTAVDVCVVRPAPAGADPRWLMWAVNAPQFRAKVSKLQSGTTRKRISRKNLATIELPVPPVHEQRLIVAAIEEQFSRLDAADESLRRSERRLEQLKSALLADAVDRDWPIEPLSSVLLSLRNGTFVSRPAKTPPGTAIFRISAVRPLSLDANDVRYAPETEMSRSDYFVSEGDLLFTRYSGNPEYVGACARVPHLPRPTLHPDKLIRAIVDRERADPAFVELACATGVTRTAIRARRKTTAGQVGIAGGQLKSVPIPLPPLDEQRRIVEAVQQRLSVIDVMRDAIAAATKRSAGLRRAILERAFRGDLVAQDPTDEPASVLLERIAAGRVKAKEVNGARPGRRATMHTS